MSIKELYGKKKDEGFTIIEVMIVLAVAGLILVIVLIAIPQLQRNQRNAARKNIVARVSTEVASYAGNNNGALPTLNNNAQTGITGGFTTRYLTGVNYQDPSTGTNYTISTGAGTPTAVGDMRYQTTQVCNGESPVATGANARNYTLSVFLEGGATYCVDNR